VGIRHRIEGQIKSWPVYRQITGTDRLGRGEAAKSRASGRLAPRTDTADAVVKSVCPYCAVGCGQNVYVQAKKVTQIEGDPDSPVSRGRLCPKGSASLQLTTGPGVADLAGGRRGRAMSALGGAPLLAASAATRWGIFHAGLASARDPKYAVVPQRERREARQQEPAGTRERATT